MTISGFGNAHCTVIGKFVENFTDTDILQSSNISNISHLPIADAIIGVSLSMTVVVIKLNKPLPYNPT